MYALAIIVLSVGISLVSFSHWIGRRKKVIDQLESDVRIFLALILIASIYLQFLSISLVYLVAVISDYDLNYVVTFFYFLLPLLLGLALYVLLPWLCGRSLHLKDIPAPENVQKIGGLLQLDKPRVCTTSQRISPLVFGRRNKSSVLVIPENMGSLLTEKEQEAVIAHELSHIKQGDVGFFTWLMLLIEGLKYWILPLPIVMYFGMESYAFNMKEHPGSILLVLVFFLSIILLKNSLSRTRESIADAYVIFHGFETPLKSALVKYAALRTAQKGYALSLCFFHNTRFGSVLATHPPLKRRLRTVDEKTFLVESLTNLSPELAFWTGFVSAFLFYNFLYSAVGFLTVADTFFSVPESVLGYTWVIICFLVIGVVGIPYIFPSTKGLTLLSDLANAAFLLPLLRNWGITILTAAGIIYGLTLDSGIFEIFLPPVVFGLFLWIAGFLASRISDFDEKMWFILFSPIFVFLLIWYPVRIIYFIFSGSVIDLSHFAASVVVILSLTLIMCLILLETGYISVDKERLILFFSKRIQVPHNYAVFGILALSITLVVPIVLSLGVYAVSCFLDSYTILPDMSLFFVIIPILLYYGFKKMDILFFTDISFLIDILKGNIHEEDIEFIQKVIEKYQSSDGGFDSAGLNFSKQKDTYYIVKTAKTLGIELENEKITEWIRSTETKEGFALISGGYPRVEGTYYAVKSLSVLGLLQDVSCTHGRWISNSFNGKYFMFKNDYLPILVQTCYATELLSLFHASDNITCCREWIKTHFPNNSKPREAFFATRALRILDSDTDLAEKWLIKNKNVLSTRLDKNVEAVYYYVKVLRELNEPIPSFIVEQAATELHRIRKKHKQKLGL